MPYLYKNPNIPVPRLPKISALNPEFPAGIAGFDSPRVLNETTRFIWKLWNTSEGIALPVHARLIPTEIDGFSIFPQKDRITVGLPISENYTFPLRLISEEKSHRRRAYIYSLMTLMEMNRRGDLVKKITDFIPAFPIRAVSLKIGKFLPDSGSLENFLITMSIARLNILFIENSNESDPGLTETLKKILPLSETLGIKIATTKDTGASELLLKRLPAVALKGYPIPDLKGFSRNLADLIGEIETEDCPGATMKIDFDENPTPIELLWLPTLEFGYAMWNASAPQRGDPTQIYFLSDEENESGELEELFKIFFKEEYNHLLKENLAFEPQKKKTLNEIRRLEQAIEFIKRFSLKAKRNSHSLKLASDYLKIVSAYLKAKKALLNHKAVQAGKRVDKVLKELSSSAEDIDNLNESLVNPLQKSLDLEAMLELSGLLGRISAQIRISRKMLSGME